MTSSVFDTPTYSWHCRNRWESQNRYLLFIEQKIPKHEYRNICKDLECACILVHVRVSVLYLIYGFL